MYIKPEDMPHRFYNPDDRDGYSYRSPSLGKDEPAIMPDVFKDYITETIRAYIELGGDTTQLMQKGFINSAGEINYDLIIEDLRQHDDLMASSVDSPEAQAVEFKEARFGFSGFLKRYTQIDETPELDHKEVGKRALENINKRSETNISDRDKRLNDSARALFAHMATGYLPRSTIVTASQMVADGAMMQIGCSQGKTTILAFASYIDMQKGLKVMNTSSNPGLVLDNFNEFCAPYDLLGASNQMCAITRDSNDKDMVVTRENLGDHGPYITTQVNEEGEITFPELVRPELKKNATKKEQESYQEALEKYQKKVKEVAEHIGIAGYESMSPEEIIKAVRDYCISNGIVDPTIPFENRVRDAIQNKGIVMADSMTLLKYERFLDELPKDLKTGSIKDSICMCDEADCEFLDARPYEITGAEYSKEVQDQRFELRKKADELIKAKLKSGEPFTREDLEGMASESNLPLEFLMDAFDVRTQMRQEGEDYVIDPETKKVTTLNQDKRVLEADTQGHVQAIFAMRANEGEDISAKPNEREVLDVKYPYQVIGKYNLHSLISGTMEDRGLSQYRGNAEGLYNRYAAAREALFETMGFRTPATQGVVNFRTVGPLTREDKGMVMAPPDGDREIDDAGKLIADENFSLGGQSWKEYVDQHRDDLERTWIERVHHEVERRTAEKPVLVSVLDKEQGKKLGAPIVYTDGNKPSEEMKEDGKMVFHKGEAYYMDDAYGRGYNSKFDGKDGHVIITSLPTNSRNLEQFLYRVARGGDKGSSSMIISPTDPKLEEFLSNMDEQARLNEGRPTADQIGQYQSLFRDDPETWNKVLTGEVKLSDAYFTSLMQGKIPLDRLVFDMYPEQTIEIMNAMTQKNDFINRSGAQIEALIATVGKNSPYYRMAIEKARASHIKKYMGQDVTQELRDIRRDAAVTMAIVMAQTQGVAMSEAEFMKLMPIPEEGKEAEVKALWERVQKRTQEIVKSKAATQERTVAAPEKEPEEREAEEHTKDNEPRDRIAEAITDYDIDADDVLRAANNVRAQDRGLDESQR